MAKLSIVAGATSQSVNIFVQNSSSTTGAGLTGFAPAAGSLLSGMIFYYSFGGTHAASVVQSLSVPATVGAAFSAGNIVEIDATHMAGVARLDLPNGMLASGNGRFVTGVLSGGTNVAPVVLEIELTGWDNQDAVHGGMSALPNASPGAANGLFICGSNAAVTINGTAASGGTPATAGLTISGGAASTSSGGTAGAAVALTGGAGAASTNGAASGMTVAGGGTNTVASSAHGLSLSGTSTGSGLNAGSGSGSTGDGITATANSTNGNGLNITGTGTGAGYIATGGSTGNGMKLVGGGTSGDAILTSVTSGNALNLAATGAGKHGLLATGGNAVGGSAAGHAFHLVGGTATTSSGGIGGAGFYTQGGTGAASTNGPVDGFFSTGGNVTSGFGNADGMGLVGTGSGNGLACFGSTNGSGINALGAGSGPGILTTGGSTGAGLQCTGGATSGSGIVGQSTNNGHGASFTGAGAGGFHGALFTGAAAVTTSAAGNGIYTRGGVANTSSGGTAGVGLYAIGGAGAASTNGAGIGAILTGGGTNTVSNTADGLQILGASNGNGATLTHAGTGKDFNATTTPLILAKTTNITGFNDISAAQAATGVWQDATAGDFTVSSSIGKSLYTSGNAPGAASGLLIAGSNAATTFTGTAASGATPATAGLTITGGAASTTSGGTSAPAISLTGGAGAATTNGAGNGLTVTGGGTTTVSGGKGVVFQGSGTGPTGGAGLLLLGAGQGFALDCSPADGGTNMSVDAQSINGISAASVTSIYANIGTTSPIVFDGNGNVDVNIVDIAGTASTGTAGYVGIDWSAIHAPTSTVNLSNTTINTVTSGVTVTTNNDKTGYALTSAYDFAKGTVAMTESYPTKGSTMTPAQALYTTVQHLGESGISGTTKTVKKRDQSTTAKTFTLDSSTAPTTVTEAS